MFATEHLMLTQPKIYWITVQISSFEPKFRPTVVNWNPGKNNHGIDISIKSRYIIRSKKPKFLLILTEIFRNLTEVKQGKNLLDEV